MEAIILTRVSDQDQQDGFSIDAQKQRLANYCEGKGFKVDRVFEIIESSTQGERKDFQKFLAYIRTKKEKVAIVTDAVDRMQRSFKETPILDDMRKEGKIELHFYKEGLIINENSSPHEIMMWDFAVMGAKQYALAISYNVKRAFGQILSQGGVIGRAPIGFINERDPMNPRRGIWTIDPVRAPLVVRAFELYSKGYPVPQIHRMLVKEGLTNNLSPYQPVSLNQVYGMLQNPVYCGYRIVKGQMYAHNYGSLIDERLFEVCRAVRAGKLAHPTKHDVKPSIFKGGRIHCQYCGCTVTPDVNKKGKYTYLKCTQHKGKCGAIRIREEVAEGQILELLKKLVIPDDVLADVKVSLQSSSEAETKYHQQTIRNLRKEYDTVQEKLKVLLDIRLELSITKDEYDEKVLQLKQRQHEIDIQLRQHTKADEDFAIVTSHLLDVVCRAHELFASSKVEQKQQLLDFLFSNLKLEGDKLLYELKRPFDAILSANTLLNWQGLVELFRTKYREDIFVYRPLVFN